MAKKISLIILFLFSVVFVKNILAQGSSRDLYKKFSESYRIYQQTVEPFKTARSQFLSFGSIDSQLKVVDATKKMLSLEIDAMLNLAQFMRLRLVEATSVLNYKENLLFVMLDDEISFLKLSKDQVSLTLSLDELKKISVGVSEHYKKITKYSYEIKLLIQIGSSQKVLENLKVEKEKIESFLQIGQVNELKLKATQNKIATLQTEINLAKESLSKAEALLKQSDAQSDKEGWKLTFLANDKLSLVLEGYKNIVSSLK